MEAFVLTAGLIYVIALGYWMMERLDRFLNGWGIGVSVSPPLHLFPAGGVRLCFPHPQTHEWIRNRRKEGQAGNG